MNKTNNKPPTDTVSVHSGRSTRSNQPPLAQRLDDPESAFRRLAQGKSARPSSREASESRFGLPPSIGRAGPATEIQPASSKIDAEDPAATSAPATHGELEPLPARPTSNTPTGNRSITESVASQVRKWLDENLSSRIGQALQESAPVAVGQLLTDPNSERYDSLIQKVADRIWTHYLDPNIKDSPLSFMIQTVVVTELGASVPPTGTVPQPESLRIHTETADPNPPIQPTEELTPTQNGEETRTRTVYLPVASGAPNPDDDGGSSDDDNQCRDDRGRRDKHGRSARNGAKDSGKRPKSDDSDDDVSDHGRPRRRKGAKKRRGSDDSSDSDGSDSELDRGRLRRKPKSKQKNKRRGRRYESNHYDSSDQSSSSSSSDSDSDYYRDRRSRKRRHRHGKRHSRKPTVIRLTNDIFSRAVDYRSYRLLNRKQEYTERIQRSMGKYEKRMKVQMAHHRFNGKDPITVLDFLARFKDSCDRNNISEAAAVWCFQYFLDGQAADELRGGFAISPQDLRDGRSHGGSHNGCGELQAELQHGRPGVQRRIVDACPPMRISNLKHQAEGILHSRCLARDPSRSTLLRHRTPGRHIRSGLEQGSKPGRRVHGCKARNISAARQRLRRQDRQAETDSLPD